MADKPPLSIFTPEREALQSTFAFFSNPNLYVPLLYALPVTLSILSARTGVRRGRRKRQTGQFQLGKLLEAIALWILGSFAQAFVFFEVQLRGWHFEFACLFSFVTVAFHLSAIPFVLYGPPGSQELAEEQARATAAGQKKD